MKEPLRTNPAPLLIRIDVPQDPLVAARLQAKAEQAKRILGERHCFHPSKQVQRKGT